MQYSDTSVVSVGPQRVVVRSRPSCVRAGTVFTTAQQTSYHVICGLWSRRGHFPRPTPRWPNMNHHPPKILMRPKYRNRVPSTVIQVKGRSVISLKECFDHYNKHMALMTYFEVFLPKHHIVYHLLKGMSYLGNPTWYASWKDEELNKTFKACCRNVSQCNFEAGLLLRMRDALEFTTGRKRPRKS